MAKVIEITNPLTGQPQQVIQSDYTAQQIDDAVGAVQSLLPGGAGLPINQGGTGANTPQMALVNLGARSNQNFFINPFFVGGGSQLGNGTFPINQQGKSSYTANNSVSIDRWIINNSTLTIKQDGVEVFGSDIYGTFTQYLENFRYFAGKTVTLSALITGGTGIGNGAYLDILDGITEYTLQINETGIISVTATLPEDITKLQAGVVTSNLSGKTLNVAAIKLELGDKQTLGYKDDSGNWNLFELSDYGDTLARCQRYLIVETAENEKPGSVYSSTSGVFTISTAVQMRTTPVLAELKGYEPKIALSDGSTVLITKEEITVLGADVSGVRVRVDVTGGKTLKLGPASIRDCNMVLSAEL